MQNRTESSGEARELRVLLEAVLEAVAIPYPATVGDSEVHDRILSDRVMDARVALEGVLHRGDEPGWSAEYLRARLAENPATGYRAAGGAEQLHDSQADEDDQERARRSVDHAFPVVAAFLAEGRAESAAADVERWNAAHPVSTPVTAYPVTRDDEALSTRTRSVAWVLGGHTAVVKVDGYAGGIALTHVDVRDEDAEGGAGR